MATSVLADAVVVSAGRGLRFGGGQKKQFLSLAGRPVLAYSLDPLEASPLIRSIVLVVPLEDIDYCVTQIVRKDGYKKVSQVVPGGATRQQSVRIGIEAAPQDGDVLLIHDGVRPFLSEEMVEASVLGALQYEAVIFGVPLKDTVKVVDEDDMVVQTLDRASLYQIQTPQSFRSGLIREAHRRAASEGFLGTDDAVLVERMGVRVRVLLGSYENIKLTTPEDLEFARLILERRDADRQKKR